MKAYTIRIKAVYTDTVEVDAETREKAILAARELIECVTDHVEEAEVVDERDLD